MDSRLRGSDSNFNFFASASLLDIALVSLFRIGEGSDVRDAHRPIPQDEFDI